MGICISHENNIVFREQLSNLSCIVFRAATARGSVKIWEPVALVVGHYFKTLRL